MVPDYNTDFVGLRGGTRGCMRRGEEEIARGEDLAEVGADSLASRQAAKGRD